MMKKECYFIDEMIEEKDILSSIIDILPGSIYWLNRDNVYLGCNNVQAKKFGLISRADIIGKTNSMLFPQSIADALDAVNKKVMNTGIEYQGEEVAYDNRYILTNKIPLSNRKGDIIGLLGMSVDITDRKTADELRIKNETQKLKIQEHEKFSDFVFQIGHDIRSPLATLGMVAKIFNKHIPENGYTALRSVITTIKDIANTLLEKYKEYDGSLKIQKDINNPYILVKLALHEVWEHKKFLYKDLKLKINYHICDSNDFSFIKGNYSSFVRMVSNLINNAVESVNHTNGIIDIILKIEEQNIKISIKDNGIGMSKKVVEKILNDVPFKNTKKNGFGIGLKQIKEALILFDGNIHIESEQNIGTKITLTIPKIKTPNFFLERLVLHKDDVVVVLDDDISIHHLWKDILKNYSNNLTVKYFQDGNEVINFIKSFEKKEKIVLLTDYELRNQKINGIDVINSTGMHSHSVVISGLANEISIYFFSKEKKVMSFPKQFLSEINVVFHDYSRVKKVSNVIIIDDYQPFAELLADNFKLNGIQADVYCDTSSLLEKIHHYHKNVAIIIDNELKEKITGIEFSHKLNDIGYSNLYLLSGNSFEKEEIPEYLKVVLKDDNSYIEKLSSMISDIEE